MKTLIEIDPGKSDAIVVLRDGGVKLVEDLPTCRSRIRKKSVVDGRAQAKIFRAQAEDSVAFLEHIVLHPVGGMNLVAASSFGKGAGIIMGVLDAFGLEYYELTPAHWKRAAGLIKQPKKASLAKARELWPTWNPRLMKHIERAEAALIAHYGARIKGVVE